MVGRDVYASGRYVGHFQPDRARNPFRALYGRKREDVISAVAAQVPAGGTVLDLGGGPGRMAVPLAGRYKVTLGDVSSDMLSMARGAAAEARIPTANLGLLRLDAAGPLPFPRALFDCALCIDVLAHLREPEHTLAELRRVLRPGGLLLIDASNRSPWWLLRYPRALGRRPESWWATWRAGGIRPEWLENVRHLTSTEFAGLLREAGFATFQSWRYGPGWCPKWFLAGCRAPS